VVVTGVWQRPAERWRSGGNEREIEKKKEVVLLEERKKQELFFL